MILQTLMLMVWGADEAFLKIKHLKAEMKRREELGAKIENRLADETKTSRAFTSNRYA